MALFPLFLKGLWYVMLLVDCAHLTGILTSMGQDSSLVELVLAIIKE